MSQPKFLLLLTEISDSYQVSYLNHDFIIVYCHYLMN